jgi:hypothetical protein
MGGQAPHPSPQPSHNQQIRLAMISTYVKLKTIQNKKINWGAYPETAHIRFINVHLFRAFFHTFGTLYLQFHTVTS